MAKDMQKKVLEHAREDFGATDDPRKAWVTAEPPKQSLWDKVADHIIDRVVPEVGNTLMQKIGHGATEISQALYNGQAFTPYGPGQNALEVEGPQKSWADQLRDASQRGHEQQHEMER